MKFWMRRNPDEKDMTATVEWVSVEKKTREPSRVWQARIRLLELTLRSQMERGDIMKF